MPINWSAPATYLLIALVAGAVGWTIFSGVRNEMRRQARAKAYLASRPVRDPAELPAIAIQRGIAGFSRIGGLPDLPEFYAWPVDDEGKPLAFLCQVALAELPEVALNLGYPETGALFFFYDQYQSAGGHRQKDFSKWRVLYVDEVASSATERAPPNGLAARSIFRTYLLGFSAIMTYWDPEDTQAVERKRPRHMMGGVPDAIQNPDMDEVCELVSNGIDVDKPGVYASAEARALLQKPNDWVLLLQFDSDDRAGFNWGDAGTLYFWIRKPDLEARDFSRVWMIAECY